MGSRAFDDYELLCRVLRACEPSSIVSGGARGADALARRYAEENGLPLTEHLPRHLEGKGEYRPGNYHERNRRIVEDCEAVVAFVAGESRGTASTVEYARRVGKPVRVVRAGEKDENDSCVPRPDRSSASQ